MTKRKVVRSFRKDFPINWEEDKENILRLMSIREDKEIEITNIRLTAVFTYKKTSLNGS